MTYALYIFPFVAFCLVVYGQEPSILGILTSESPFKLIFLFLLYWFSLSFLIPLAIYALIFFIYVYIWCFLIFPNNIVTFLLFSKIRIRENLRLFIPLAIGLVVFLAWLYSINFDYVFAEQWNNQNEKSCNYINNSLLKMNLCFVGLVTFTFFLTVFCVIVPLLFVLVPLLILASIAIAYKTILYPFVDGYGEAIIDKDCDGERRKFFVVLGILWILIGYCLIYIYFVSDPWTPLLNLFSPLISHFHFYPYF